MPALRESAAAAARPPRLAGHPSCSSMRPSVPDHAAARGMPERTSAVARRMCGDAPLMIAAATCHLSTTAAQYITERLVEANLTLLFA